VAARRVGDSATILERRDTGIFSLVLERVEAAGEVEELAGVREARGESRKIAVYVEDAVEGARGRGLAVAPVDGGDLVAAPSDQAGYLATLPLVAVTTEARVSPSPGNGIGQVAEQSLLPTSI
jgi:hypothetical protein